MKYWLARSALKIQWFIRFFSNKAKFLKVILTDSSQWRIQDFPEERAPTPQGGANIRYFPKTCMKLKEFGPRWGGGRVPRAPLRSATGLAASDFGK